jgi:hypothetical protein
VSFAGTIGPNCAADVRRGDTPPRARARDRDRDRDRDRRPPAADRRPPTADHRPPTPPSPASKSNSPLLMSVLWVAGCAPTVIGPFPVSSAMPSLGRSQTIKLTHRYGARTTRTCRTRKPKTRIARGSCEKGGVRTPDFYHDADDRACARARARTCAPRAARASLAELAAANWRSETQTRARGTTAGAAERVRRNRALARRAREAIGDAPPLTRARPNARRGL